VAKQLELPKFIVSPSEDYPQWLKVVCPREDCVSNGQFFLVNRRIWRRPKVVKSVKGGAVTIIGRPCAYCGRYGALPS